MIPKSSDVLRDSLLIRNVVTDQNIFVAFCICWYFLGFMMDFCVEDQKNSKDNWTWSKNLLFGKRWQLPTFRAKFTPFPLLYLTPASSLSSSSSSRRVNVSQAYCQRTIGFLLLSSTIYYAQGRRTNIKAYFLEKLWILPSPHHIKNE